MTAPLLPIGLAQEIYEDLRKRILSGELSPGTRLPAERELSESYGSNRNTLREAFRKLEQDGLISVRHGQGVTVEDFRKSGHVGMLGAFFEHGVDPGEKARALLDLLPARALVIEFAITVAAERAEATDLARLDEEARRVMEAFDRADDAALALGFQQWIDAVIDAAHSLPLRWIGNPFFQAERDIHARFPTLYVREPSLPTLLRDAMSALRQRDAAGAGRATRAYFATVDRQVTSMLGHGLARDDAQKQEEKAR